MATPAQASATLPRPAVERVNARLAFVRSESDPTRYYHTGPDHCTCPDWQHRHGKSPDYRCKHMRLAFPAPTPSPRPAPFYCIGCGQIPARADDVYCRDCAPRPQAPRLTPLPTPSPVRRAELDLDAERARIAARNTRVNREIFGLDD